jgi:hypothetical protein
MLLLLATGVSGWGKLDSIDTLAAFGQKEGAGVDLRSQQHIFADVCGNHGAILTNVTDEYVGLPVEVPGVMRTQQMEEMVSAEMLTKQDAFMKTAGNMTCDPAADLGYGKCPNVRSNTAQCKPTILCESVRAIELS